MKHVKYLIIGAGVSGLTFAYQKRNEDFLILEKEAEIGGLARSFNSLGFTWDVAGHFFHFHNAETERFYGNFVRDHKTISARKCAKIFYGGKFIDAPFQYNIHQLEPDEFFQCLTDLYYSGSKKDVDNFEDFVVNEYGEGISSKFIIPYNEKLYACKMNSLEKDSMREFLPKLDFDLLMKHYKGAHASTYNDVFEYPVEGCSVFVKELARSLPRERIRTEQEVVSIDLSKRTVATKTGEFHYEYLINSAPLNVFLSCAGQHFGDLLRYNKVLVFNIGFDKKSLDQDVSWAYFPGNEVFYRVGFYNNIVKDGPLSIYVEIGLSKDECVDLDDAFTRVMGDLKRAGIITDHKVVTTMSFVISPGYVHITKDGKKFVGDIIHSLNEKGVYMLGRYARWEYSAMDDSIEQANGLAKLI